jgi:hypothetical protein
MQGNPQRRRAGARTQAQRADRYELYEATVQDVDFDCSLVDRMFKSRYGRAPRLLREDFCGSAAMACEWVQRNAGNCAFGIDLDPEPLEWSRRHHFATLTPDEASRLALIRGDVRDVETGPVDVNVAFNFSYFVFKQRGELLGYFEKSRARLRRQGLFVIDLYGGADSHRTLTETRDLGDYDYVWDQDLFDPISYRVVNHIHFLKDGSRWARLQPRLAAVVAAGTARPATRPALHVQPYWERTTTTHGQRRLPAHRAKDDPAWVAYVAAFR